VLQVPKIVDFANVLGKETTYRAAIAQHEGLNKHIKIKFDFGGIQDMRFIPATPGMDGVHARAMRMIHWARCIAGGPLARQ
jgi:hypothetical protein